MSVDMTIAQAIILQEDLLFSVAQHRPMSNCFRYSQKLLSDLYFSPWPPAMCFSVIYGECRRLDLISQGRLCARCCYSS